MTKKLKVLNNNSAVEGVTCFSIQAEHRVSCKRQKCDHWIDSEINYNCVIIASDTGPRTLQEVGDFFNLTRMRICQIEKNIYDKIRIEEKLL